MKNKERILGSVAVEKNVKIKNKLGLHARPAALFVQAASKYKSEIKVEKAGEEVNGKSILGLMSLAAAHHDAITLKAEGEDATEAIDRLEGLIESKFGEE